MGLTQGISGAFVAGTDRVIDYADPEALDTSTVAVGSLACQLPFARTPSCFLAALMLAPFVLVPATMQAKTLGLSRTTGGVTEVMVSSSLCDGWGNHESGHVPQKDALGRPRGTIFSSSVLGHRD